MEAGTVRGTTAGALASYRTVDNEVLFGRYGITRRTGVVSVGDSVKLTTKEAAR